MALSQVVISGLAVALATKSVHGKSKFCQLSLKSVELDVDVVEPAFPLPEALFYGTDSEEVFVPVDSLDPPAYTPVD